jgi:ketosteroid isomerase-like protein
MSTEENLPAAVRRVLAAVDALDADAFVAAFAPDGFVDDWGRQFRGPEPIRSWSDGEFIGKNVTFTGTQVSTPGNPVTIATQVGGDGFNGPSHFTFDVRDDQIASMTITA